MQNNPGTLWAKAQRLHGQLAQERLKTSILHQKIASLERQNLKLSSDLALAKKPMTFYSTQRPYLRLSKASRYRRRVKLRTFWNKFAAKLPKDIVLSKLVLQFQGGGSCQFKFPPSANIHQELLSLPPTPLKKPTQNTLAHILSVKDRFHISDKALHQMKKCFPYARPITLYKMKGMRKIANCLLPIHTLEDKSHDFAWRDVKDVVLFLLNHPENAHIMEAEEPQILLRFATDGSKVHHFSWAPSLL